MGITIDTVLRNVSAAVGVVNRRRKDAPHGHARIVAAGRSTKSRIEVQRVAGEEYVTDIFTQNVKSELIEKHVADMWFVKISRT